MADMEKEEGRIEFKMNKWGVIFICVILTILVILAILMVMNHSDPAYDYCVNHEGELGVIPYDQNSLLNASTQMRCYFEHYSCEVHDFYNGVCP